MARCILSVVSVLSVLCGRSAAGGERLLLGFVAAFDNRRLLVGFAGKGVTTAVTKQTLDGGKTWQNIPFGPTGNPDHGCSRGSVVGQDGARWSSRTRAAPAPGCPPLACSAL